MHNSSIGIHLQEGTFRSFFSFTVLFYLFPVAYSHSFTRCAVLFTPLITPHDLLLTTCTSTLLSSLQSGCESTSMIVCNNALLLISTKDVSTLSKLPTSVFLPCYMMVLVFSIIYIFVLFFFFDFYMNYI